MSMDNEEHNIDEQPNRERHTEQVPVAPIERVAPPTRQLTAQQSRRVAQENNALRERIAVLVAALGDPEHILHQQALQDLVAIGDPAVPALNEALNPRRPWLVSYRATEALGQIGDGRATGPLIEALRHTNSNVRWGAVRALSAIGDARALLDLRRVATNDRSKTSWGESVSGAAQSAIEQMRTQNVLLRSADLFKTAIACVLMLVALILAWSAVSAVRNELRTVGRVPPPTVLAPTADSSAQSAPAADAATTPEAAPTAAPTPEPTAAPTEATGKVLSTANVRATPNTTGDQLGTVRQNDDIVFVATTQDRSWYRIRLGANVASASRINSADSTGWVRSTLLSAPAADANIAIEQPQSP